MTSTALAAVTAVSKPPAEPDYAQLRQDLVLPLGALIVATRGNSPNIPRHLSDFNAAAERVELVIATDMWVNANRLHSANVNVRDAAARKDLATLERERLGLLDVR